MKKILSIINIIFPIILLPILIIFTELNQNIATIIMLTLFIGFIMPFICLLITGLCMLNNTHHILSIIINTLNILLSSIIIYLIISIIDKNLILSLIEYITMLIISLINIIFILLYLKKIPNQESINIKKEKQKNNGAIV